MSGFLAAGGPAQPAPPAAPPGPQLPAAAGGDPSRNGGLLLLAGIGLLLLAMGIGVLIGRSSAKSSPGPAQVVTIGSSPAGAASGGGEEAAFSDDWPSGTRGWTVQLQTLPKSATTRAQVEQAKSAATSKGASSVGALLSDHFSSLVAGSYILYSGVYHKEAEARKALGGLKSKFPGAKVIEVSEGSGSGPGGGSGSAGAKEGAGGSSSGSGGGSLSHPAPPASLESLKKARGKNYVEKSKNLPNVVSTG
ncbi:MAG: hypothetical protein ACYDC2_12085 [Solirubrobacteraceae bacterium]